ncbi:predicted protein [Uncinocarpus reesii 1704]|uniref:Uncharacterized protein n=1 Tax=Uncinocarpus reesii (strain UAMH 1704) TaxID=336963 RepID=C4JFY1_UNCRE|nr:uncharacterized protein UREG_01061 [Uncinocarpus reesii 1704]EEP76212.1 predicted protein [Uncinocarpus reesii 1704]
MALAIPFQAADSEPSPKPAGDFCHPCNQPGGGFQSCYNSQADNRLSWLNNTVLSKNTYHRHKADKPPDDIDTVLSTDSVPSFELLHDQEQSMYIK